MATVTNAAEAAAKPVPWEAPPIPIYLLIDRTTGEVKVHSQPDGERYGLVTAVPFGKTVTLPDPVGMELDTEPLKDWVH